MTGLVYTPPVYDAAHAQREAAQLGRMIPIDLKGCGARTLTELIRIALWNIDQSDVRPTPPPDDPTKYMPTPRELRAVWLRQQAEDVRVLARKAPVEAIYRIKGGVVSATRGISPIAIVTSYKSGQRGEPATAGCVVLGVVRGLGSPQRPLSVPLEGLEVVTEDARHGRLPEQRL